MTDHIVVGDRVLLDISFRAAWARLGILGWDGVLLGASEEAYGESIAGLVKLAGPAAGLTRLAGVGLENLAETDDCAHIALQWEAIAADGKLFAALDADLMLVPAGDQTAVRRLPRAGGPGCAGRRSVVADGGMPHLRATTAAGSAAAVVTRRSRRWPHGRAGAVVHERAGQAGDRVRGF